MILLTRQIFFRGVNLMKKFWIVFINIILICLIFLGVDYTSARIDHNQNFQSIMNDLNIRPDKENIREEMIPVFSYNLKLIHFKKFWQNTRIDFPSERRVVHASSDAQNCTPPPRQKNSIIVFGCSFAEGAFLEDNETFEYKLSKLTNRTVYNRGFSGFGLGQMVWQTKQPEFYEDIKEPVDYVIYIYIFDHLRRIYEHKYGHINVYLGYEEKNGQLVEKNPPMLQLNRFHIIKKLYTEYLFKKYYLSQKNKDKNFDLIKLHFEEARKELQKRYPNVKFIILKHPCDTERTPFEVGYYIIDSYTTPRWKELEDEGFIVKDLKTYIPNINFESQEYTFPDGHPNQKAWDAVAEKLVKDLNL